MVDVDHLSPHPPIHRHSSPRLAMLLPPATMTVVAVLFASSANAAATCKMSTQPWLLNVPNGTRGVLLEGDL
jgi:hypothetical protein